MASILFDYLYRILKFLRNSTNAMTAQAVGKEDDEGVLLAGLRSGLIAVAIAVLILCLQYPKSIFELLTSHNEINREITKSLGLKPCPFRTAFRTTFMIK